MTLEGELKNPDCPNCHLLDSIGVPRQLINDYHEDKIPLTKLPKIAQKLLKRHRKSKGY